MPSGIYQRKVRPIAQRFWEKVSKTDTCWLWNAFRDWEGYGRFQLNKTVSVSAHRFAFELVNGEIPEGHCILHRCDVRACVNPDHLFSGTQTENMKDMDRKGRRVKRGAKSDLKTVAL